MDRLVDIIVISLKNNDYVEKTICSHYNDYANTEKIEGEYDFTSDDSDSCECKGNCNCDNKCADEDHIDNLSGTFSWNLASTVVEAKATFDVSCRPQYNGTGTIVDNLKLSKIVKKPNVNDEFIFQFFKKGVDYSCLLYYCPDFKPSLVSSPREFGAQLKILANHVNALLKVVKLSENQPMFKIGKTVDCSKRLSQYKHNGQFHLLVTIAKFDLDSIPNVLKSHEIQPELLTLIYEKELDKKLRESEFVHCPLGELEMIIPAAQIGDNGGGGRTAKAENIECYLYVAITTEKLRAKEEKKAKKEEKKKAKEEKKAKKQEKKSKEEEKKDPEQA